MMFLFLRHIVGRRLLAKGFPGGSRTYLTSAFQNIGIRKALVDRGILIEAAVGGGIGGYTYHFRCDADEARIEADAQARYLRHTEAVDKEMLEVWDEYKAKEGILARLEEDCKAKDATQKFKRSAYFPSIVYSSYHLLNVVWVWAWSWTRTLLSLSVVTYF